MWAHYRATAITAGVHAFEADFSLRFHACRHLSISWVIAHGSQFQDEGYWYGHQTAGNELIHPIAGGDLNAHWQRMGALMRQLLDELGATEPVVQAISVQDGLALKSLLPPLPAPLHPTEKMLRRAAEMDVQGESDEKSDGDGEIGDDAEREEDTDD